MAGVIMRLLGTLQAHKALKLTRLTGGETTLLLDTEQLTKHWL